MKRWLRWGAVVLAWVSLLGFSLLLNELANSGDFRKYYHAARDYLPEQMPYASLYGDIDDTLNYPPLTPLMLMPIARSFDMVTGTRIWFVINVAVLLALVATLARYLRSDQRFALWLAVALFAPLIEALRIGQISIALMGLVGFAWVAAKSDRPRLAGFLLAVATWIKLYPALILLYFVFRRDWRVAGAGVVGVIALGLLQLAITGIGTMVEFARTMLMISGSGETQFIWRNMSIYGFAGKLFEPHYRVVPLADSPLLFAVTRYGLTSLALGMFVFLSLKAPAAKTGFRKTDLFDLEFGLVILTMLLVSPWLYSESITPVLITLFLLFRLSYRLLARVTLAFVLFLLYLNYFVQWQEGTAFQASTFIAGFCGLGLLWGLNVGQILRARRSAALPLPEAA